MSISNEDRELIDSFIVETREMIEEVEPLLIQLQNAIESAEESDGEVINAIFRLFHTIKGTAGFLNFTNLQSTTHVAESLLDNYRKGRVALTNVHIDVLLETVDYINLSLDTIEKESTDDSLTEEAEKVCQLFEGLPNNAPASEDEEENEYPQLSFVENNIPVPKDAPPPIKFNITDEMKAEFLDESEESLEMAEQLLMELESNKNDIESLNNVFREIHSFKGNCGIFNYSHMEALAHKSETVLDLMRRGAKQDFAVNIRMIRKIVETLRETVHSMRDGEKADILGFDGMDMLMEETIRELATPEQLAEIFPDDQDATVATGDFFSLGEEEKPKKMKKVPKKVVKKKPVPKVANKKPATFSQSIRIDLDKVDKLVNWVGELAIAELMVVQNPDVKDMERTNFDRASFNLHNIITEVQNLALSLRMIPLTKTFQKMHRLVRDLSIKADKKIDLQIIGEDTEVDKSVVDLISDPLIHIVRNAIDHGIELAADRIKKGKTVHGNITLSAQHESGEVWICVEDDGKGLHKEAILKKAIQNGLITGDGSNMDDHEIFALVMEPGFSTAEKITEISGRGVGMDVVKRNLEKIKGHLEIESTPGKGSLIRMRIPLTMAVIEGMVVQIGHKQYIIPLNIIREFFQPEEDDITITPAGEEIVRIREELINIMRLYELYEMKPKYDKIHEGILVTVEYRGKYYCLFVDQVVGQQQAVIKPVPNYISYARGISGFTMLSDGDVCPILDISSLINMNADLKDKKLKK